MMWIVAASAAVWPAPDDVADAPWQSQEGGLEVQDVLLGEGTEVVNNSNVEVHYVGMLADGVVFDSSRERDETFSLRVGAGGVIEGWEKGLIGMKVGGRRRLKIPAALGYGDNAAGSIPPDSVLYFDIELFSVQAPRTPPATPGSASSFRKGSKGVQFADLIVGTGNKVKSGERTCVDLAIWANGELVDHTYAKPHCWWIRYDHTLIMDGLTLGMKGMRAGGTRQIQVPASLAISTRAEKANVPPGVNLVVDVVVVEAD